MSRREINAFKQGAYHRKEYAFVSASTPLLSNLSMIENIALILQTHGRLSRKAAQKIAYDELKRLELLPIAALRYEACSEKEIFFIQLIRAHMQKDAKIVIDQPFVFLAEEMDLSIILDALDRLLISYQDVLIIDLMHQQSHYRESACHIEK